LAAFVTFGQARPNAEQEIRSFLGNGAAQELRDGYDYGKRCELADQACSNMDADGGYYYEGSYINIKEVCDVHFPAVCSRNGHYWEFDSNYYSYASYSHYDD